MKTLPAVKATAEQLPLISQNRYGVEVICGAAGSGKTSTALLRLRSLCLWAKAGKKRRQDDAPVKVLVLTFNRTLAGYIRALAEQQIDAAGIELEIKTFARWAMDHLGSPTVLHQKAESKLHSLCAGMAPLATGYAFKEAEYVMGRFTPDALEKYLAAERTGRGSTPRVDAKLRRRLLDLVIYPYRDWLEKQQVLDWNELALMMCNSNNPIGYDIVIVDESQDFSAHQLRAIKHHIANNHAVTFVIDTMQRIYARGFTWIECGFEVRPERVHALKANHRNTKQIAAFAAGILRGFSAEADGALPDLKAAVRDGDKPRVLLGRYSEQVAWAMEYLHGKVDLSSESVAFLKPKGGNYFNELRKALRGNDFPFVDITREAEWPEGPTNIALCTFHSAKGLEFDHVIILGFNQMNTPHDDDENADDEARVLRRLLAVAVARAKKSVVLGYKPGEGSKLVHHFDPTTFDSETL